MLTASELQHQLCSQPGHDYLNTKPTAEHEAAAYHPPSPGTALLGTFPTPRGPGKVLGSTNTSMEAKLSMHDASSWRMTSNTGIAPVSDASRESFWVKDTWQPSPGASRNSALSKIFPHQQKGASHQFQSRILLGCSSSLIWGKARAITGQEWCGFSDIAI